MKKVYTKPELFCEEYELSASIAGGCGKEFPAYNVNTTSYQSCSYKMGPDTLFVESNGLCNTYPAYEDEYICYMVASEGSLAFSS